MQLPFLQIFKFIVQITIDIIQKSMIKIGSSGHITQQQQLGLEGMESSPRNSIDQKKQLEVPKLKSEQPHLKKYFFCLSGLLIIGIVAIIFYQFSLQITIRGLQQKLPMLQRQITSNLTTNQKEIQKKEIETANQLDSNQDKTENLGTDLNQNINESKSKHLPIQTSFTKKNTEELQNEKKKNQINKSQYFSIPQQYWVFQQENTTYLQSLILQNNKRFVKLSNFTVNFLNKQNYHQYLSKQANNRLRKTINILQERITNEQSNLKFHIDYIEKRLILLNILYENGGIIAQEIFTITENFNWIQQIKNNIYVNRGNAGVQPQIVGFYSPYYSSQISKQHKVISSEMEEVDRYMVVIPAIQTYFIAAVKNAEYIVRLIKESYNILIDPKSVISDISSQEYAYIKLEGTDIYYQYLLLASQRVLLQKQKQLDNSHQKGDFRTFAIDYYGLNLINCVYGPFKNSLYFKYVNPEIAIQHLARYDIKEYQVTVGPIKYISFPIFSAQKNDFLTRIKNSTHTGGKGIMKGSYMQKMYFPQGNEAFIYQNIEKSYANKFAQQWSRLPKIIWVYWGDGISHSTAQTYLCVQKMKQMSARSGFVLRQLNNSNIHRYLDHQTFQKIKRTIENAKLITYGYQTLSDLYRLAILYKFGGVYMDASTVPIQNFDWIINIAKYPSQFIYNRFGQVPSVLMFWHPLFGGYFDWQINSQTKLGWKFAYESSFIAAVKNNQFIKEWLELHLKMIQTPIEQILNILKQNQVTGQFSWISEKEHYLLVMDTVKCVLGRRQKELKKLNTSKWSNANHYYKLWSMNGFLGQSKIRQNTNYENQNPNGEHYFFFRHSQQYAEGIIGKAKFFIKFIGPTRKTFNLFLLKNKDNIINETHSQSFFRKYLYNQKYVIQDVNAGAMIKV